MRLRVCTMAPTLLHLGILSEPRRPLICAYRKASGLLHSDQFQRPPPNPVFGTHNEVTLILFYVLKQHLWSIYYEPGTGLGHALSHKVVL